MKIRKGCFLSFFILLCSLSILTYADVKLKGEISGLVLDENEEALPGVNVTLTGEKLFQQSLSHVSDAKGFFRFHNLNPGIYELELTIEGFNSLKLQNLEVRVGQVRTIRAKMTLKKLAEEVTVVAQAPLIDAKTTQLSTNYDESIIKDIPTSRKFLDFMNVTPGINDNGAYGAGGESHESGMAEYPRGSSTSSFKLNGVEVSDSEFGDVWINPSYETIEEIQVVGIGAGVEYGNFTGSMVNIITKSGSNKFTGGFSAYFHNDSLQGDNSDGIFDLKPYEVKYDLDFSVSLGGYLIKEKLFFYLVGGYTGLKSKEYEAFAYSTKKQYHYYGKVDWVVNKNNSLSLMFNTDPLDHTDLGLDAINGPEIGYSTNYNTTSWMGHWNSFFGANAILSLKYTGYKSGYEYLPVSLNDKVFWDFTTGRQYGSFGRIIGWYRTRHEVNASLTYYADDFLNSSHEFKFGVEYDYSTIDNNDVFAGGGYSFAYLYDAYTAGVWAVETEGVDSESNVRRISAFAQDNIRIGSKINLNLGLRLDVPRLAAKGISATVVQFSDISPRIGLSYDIGGDMQNVLHLHYGRYYDKFTMGGWGPALPGMSDVYFYAAFWPAPFVYDKDQIESIVNPENLLFVMSFADPIPVESGLHSPYTDVFNVGFEKQLWKDFALSIDYIYKRDRDMISAFSRTEHTYEKQQWTDPFLGNTIDVWQQTDWNPDEGYYANSKKGKRRHHFIILNLRKRMTGNWSLMTSFTYQNSKGNVDNTSNEALWYGVANRDNDPYFDENQNPYIWGPLTYDRPFQFKCLLTLRLPMGILASGNFTALSGRAWTPTLFSTNAGINRTAVWRFDLLLEKRGSRRLHTDKFFNLRLSKSFKLNFSSLELFVDVLNVFNNSAGIYNYNQPMDIYPISGESAFGKPTRIRPPRQVRFALRWTF